MSGIPSPDYYKILQVDPLAEEEVVEAAYRRLARKYHPDVYAGPDASERMRELNLAYSVIGNAAQRRVYDSTRQREAARQQLAAQAQQSMTRRTTTGRQRAVSAATPIPRPPEQDDEVAPRRSRQAAVSRMQSKIPSVKVSTGDWPAITPTTGKLPVTPLFVYRRPFSMMVFEELRNLGQGLLVIGLLGYPMAVAVCWFPLQAIWSHLQLSQHQALLFTLALLAPPMLALSWWFGRRVRRDKL
ncbi:MAG TPA: J domain-containing protein [Ktedonobacterales bacterium]|jgi:pyruvate/2-oxoglutarate dehydrogenase complex dihydrolipoamide acyltransferase (E2) component